MEMVLPRIEVHATCFAPSQVLYDLLAMYAILFRGIGCRGLPLYPIVHQILVEFFC